ncbi:MAG: hypothetical protein ABFD83_08690 [Armatimonadota bacterium]
MQRIVTEMRILIMIISCLVLCLCLLGCGGGGSSTPNVTAATTTATGQFIDAPVAGLTYESGSITGVTNADGSFTYEVGKSVRFSIGGKLALGEAQGQSVITPVDLVDETGANASTPEVVKIVRLLMTLNNSGTNDKMSFSSGVLDKAADQSMTNIQSLSSDGLLSIVKALDSTKTALVSEADAEDHLSDNLAKLLVGTWLYRDGSHILAITFLDSSRYIGIEEGASDGGGHTGMEIGSYTWDPKTSAFTGSASSVNTNGDWGFDGGFSSTAAISGNVLTIQGDIDKLTKVASDSSKPLVGAWISADSNNDVLLVFLADGTYLMAEHHTAVEYSCGDGMERGTYSWNPATGVISATVITDTSGDWGFSDAGIVTITISGNTLTWVNKDGTHTAMRVTE